jgi:glutamyl-tRNA synthetase
MNANAQLVGRLAPSPTGAQHVGNARTYLLAWLSIRSRGGKVILRMEDIDSPRVKRGAAAQAIEDLRWLGLDWDEGPDIGGPHAPYIQTQRLELYGDALEKLKAAESVYPCTCTRLDVEAAASAPHLGQEGPIYPGTCATRRVADAILLPSGEGDPRSGSGEGLPDRSASRYAWRFRTTHVPRHFDDFVAGPQTCNVAAELGDFIVAKSDGSPAYQLAVVVDDNAMSVTEVLRGDDLLPSAFRQLELYDFFGWQAPQFAHVPLVVGPDGRRLAKRHGDTRLATLREGGVPAERLIGLLAWSCGLIDRAEAARACDLLDGFSLSNVAKGNWTLTPEHYDWLIAGKRTT